MRGVSVFVVLLVVLAGCTAPLSPTEDGRTTTTATPTTAEGQTPATATAEPTTTAQDTPPAPTTATPAPTTTPEPTTPAPTPEPTPTTTPASGFGPWGSDPVVIAVEVPEGDDREYASLVSEAAAFWEANDARYLGYEIDYEVDADARNPDLVVRFSDDIPECSGQADAAGCAPYITDRRQIDRPETVYVRTGFGDRSTAEVIEHELGHTLGLDHDDEPAELMNATSILYTLPRTNATDKAFPWDDSSFTVYVNDTGAADTDAARDQVRNALDYYTDGAPGMPDNVTFTYVSDPDEAEVRISFAETSPCVRGAASCAAASGYDPDGDGALETYGGLRIVLVDLDTDAVGWHVGYWFAHYLGAEDDEDKPDPFRNATYSERRSEWWNE
ncbi:Matrixin [Haloferax mucosum ATCC BAA-1512]|uniref:Matrixin n=1 Tax=Haloferax mucosum ATCC BAA-1512 TaxID=662479 RepID=M0I7Z9_9EURY|nr:Matrixin [Haloferax mucosum]ELZ92945.1 Matrixin [Haloferax mucosum ATCC BAA-1512]